MDLSTHLALHSLAMMFIWVPFVALQAVADLIRERRARAGVAPLRPPHRWYTPLLHPLRSAHDARTAPQH